MLRCTAAGLIPLMNSARFATIADILFQEQRSAFEAVIRHQSYYILTSMPQRMAKVLLLPVLPALAQRQQKNGLWRNKDSVKRSCEILLAVAHAKLTHTAGFKHSPLPCLRDHHDEHALILKRLLGAAFTAADNDALSQLQQTITGTQEVNGSFGGTVTGTVIHIERLLALGISKNTPVIQHGIEYLLAQRKPTLQGIHTTAPYSLVAENIFTSDNRDAEFQAAQTYKPEWLPSHVCFRTMAMIPNAVCLNLLVRLGLESNPGVTAALTSQYALYRKHGGFCATDIKKPYL